MKKTVQMLTLVVLGFVGTASTQQTPAPLYIDVKGIFQSPPSQSEKTLILCYGTFTSLLNGDSESFSNLATQSPDQYVDYRFGFRLNSSGAGTLDVTCFANNSTAVPNFITGSIRGLSTNIPAPGIVVLMK